ncbi:phosphonate metabolism protein/1,5-bisphosphokinase (PRPP-forming) PhnN [Sagittula stellata]|uniref:Ribose 1,5-bisphosphate phosphokinase PhnN n=1 Tax=Sagittula stellata (strain ATCC 700073 / DSM 11524 / E-37) TaxID=388399 RepID=A3K6N1_SAGS3|nr:phosphonate metabolism protein/1,5-bisphosphokinase (PRPP-forming) PhnN [Sagittula stellata]EBA07008.1 alkylphosphonate utilization protein PhnN [Sagittula stellata E-37]
MSGRLIAVVGPSGVGKDSVMQGIAAASPTVGLVRRVSTRDAAAGGEVFDAVTPTRFGEMRAQGAFCLSWQAHGLSYGIPSRVLEAVRDGAELVANLSRSVLPEAQAQFPCVVVLNLTATPETLAARLAGRGRESAPEIARRLARAGYALPAGMTRIDVSNDGPLERTVTEALARLHPVRA